MFKTSAGVTDPLKITRYGSEYGRYFVTSAAGNSLPSLSNLPSITATGSTQGAPR